jgi:hypothetical protein
MASDYGRNFGFRRSDEVVRVSEGRFRTPASGAALLIGTAVTVDPANKGFLKPAAASADVVPGVTGLLVQEEAHWNSIYEVHALDSNYLGVAKKNTLSVITTGAGTKVWFKNTTAASRLDGRQTPGVSLVDFTGGIAVGDTLGWNGTRFVKSATNVWMTVTDVNVDRGYLEGVLVK